MTSLDNAVFQSNEAIPRRRLLEFRVRRVGDINIDLREYFEWDGEARIATVALGLKDNGFIDRGILHLGGYTEVKRIDASVAFGKNYAGSGHHVKIDKIDLSSLVFHGSLVSAHLGPSDFTWTVERPSASDPSVWRQVPRDTVLKDGGFPLHLRAVCQPWSGADPRLKIDLGLISCTDASEISGHDHARFPMVGFLSTYAVFMPTPEWAGECGLPSVPFLIDPRLGSDEDTDDVILPTSMQVKKSYTDLFTNCSAPHNKSGMDNLAEALKGAWRKEKVAKYNFPVPREEDPDPRPEPTEGKLRPHLLHLSLKQL